MYHPKITHSRLKSTVIATVIAVMSELTVSLWLAEAQCTGNDPTAPCFAQNNDILTGQRSLLRDDDLFVNLWTQPQDNAAAHWLTLNTSQLTISSQSESTFNFSSCALEGTALAQSTIGRVFALPNDVIASVRPNNACTALNLFITDPKDLNNDSSLFVANLDNTPVTMTMADFNRDGYQDIFFIDQLGAQVYTAKCNNEPSASCTGTKGNSPSDGLKQGPRLTLDHRWFASPPVTGDFNGDGVIDVAWPTYDANANIQIHFMSVCPSANATVLGQTCAQPLQLIQSNTHISTGGKVNFTSRLTPRFFVALTANNFNGSVNRTTGIATDELLVAQVRSDNTTAALTVYTFDQNLAAQIGPSTTFTNLEADENNTLQLFLASGRLDWSNSQAQAVFGSTVNSSQVDHRGLLSVITFDDTLNMTQHNATLNTGSNSDKKTRIFGLALGRFDPPDPAADVTDFNQQIAALVDFHANSTHAQLFTINPSLNSFSPKLVVDKEISSTRYYDNDFIQLAALQAGDLQGRSLLLGAPTKTTVTQTQADVILGLPPMHVDFITPPGGVTPEILNLSVFPNTFNTGYDFEATTSSQSSREHTTSTSTATEVTVKGKRVWGNPKTSNVTAKLALAVGQSHETEVSKNFDTYSSRSDSFSSETDFDDLVAASSVRMNVWAYPVIGQFVCPESSADHCPDTEKVPLTVLFSGPDNIVYIQPANAGGFEWFQPVTEPGNIFSYPGSVSLLEAGEAQQNPAAESVDLLTPDNVIWESQSTQTVGIEWKVGQGKKVSSGSVNEVSFDSKMSVSAQSKFVGGSTSGSLSVDYNNSLSLSTLNTSTQTFDASSGVILHRGLGAGGAAEDPDFLYAGQTYIFGLPQPEGAIQTDVTVPTDVKTHGRIEVAHAANMLSTGFIQSGDWWKQAYTVAPDVALNHPQRWMQKLPTAQNPQQVMFNCPIGFTSALDAPTSDPGACTSTTTQPNPVNINDSSFYVMKGLFVLPDGATTGSTTTLATLGDVVTLQARVYNYSLKNMEPGTTVHVRFYAQPWDGTKGQFASGDGKFGFAPAVFIGEDILEPIPAFCGGSQGAFDPCDDPDAPLNWTLAQVQWDTSTLNPPPLTGTNWKFWVVTWIENGGQLVREIAQHGLTSIPEQNVASLAEAPIETYSNNLGFYNQVFTLELPTTNTLAATAPSETESNLGLEAFEVSSSLLRDRLATVRIHHRASGRRFDHVLALLYDGDPEQGGKVLDMEIIPRIEAEERFVVPFSHVPRTCGPQRLFVQAIPTDGQGPSVIGEVPISVDCPVLGPTVTKFAGKAEKIGSGTNNAKLQMSGKVTGVGPLALNAATLRLTSVLRETGGAGELLQALSGALLPLHLTARPGSKATQALFETPSGVTPKVQAELKQRDPRKGELEFRIKIERASIKAAQLCGSLSGGSTRMQSAFTLTDGLHGAVTVHTTQPWQCKKDQLTTP